MCACNDEMSIEAPFSWLTSRDVCYACVLSRGLANSQAYHVYQFWKTWEALLLPLLLLIVAAVLAKVIKVCVQQ